MTGESIAALSRPRPPSVDTLLECLRTGSGPDTWMSARDVVAAEHAELADLLAAGVQGYGVTTRVGHRDDEQIVSAAQEPHLMHDAFQRELLDSHRLPGRAWATSHQARCISLAKAQLLSLGGTGIDPELYDLVVCAATDDTFTPPVPLDASYSCGDVIPGAWWATALLEHYGDRYLGPKQGLTLISGVYVHAGVCLASFGALEGLIRTLREVAAAAIVAGSAKPETVALTEAGSSPHTRALGADDREPAYREPRRPGQDPVAIRATPSVLRAGERCLDELASTLEQVLTTPSDNPLLRQGKLVEQDSFMSLDLAMATSAMIETVLLCATWIERAVAWLCGGGCGLPPDLRDGDGLGLIQVPKLMTAHVERLRAELSGRVFASGSSTSHGVEDLWSHGLHACAQLDRGAATVHELLALAGATVARAVALGAPATDTTWDWTQVPGRSFRDDVSRFREILAWNPTG